MNYPTGMGLGTGNHYNNVAAQMRAYLNHGGQRNYASYQGHYGGGSATQLLHYGAQRLGVNPAIVNDVGGFARSFMRGILR